MIVAAFLLSSAVFAPMPAAASAAPPLYRIELTGNSAVWSQDRPQQTGTLLVFHRYPDGVLMSVRSSDVRRMSAVKFQPTANKQLTPGERVDIGITGSGSASANAAAGAARGKAAGAPAPGERKDGTALMNPNRAYRPDYDSKEVPGLNIPYPASPNDYREGRTFGYPSAPSPPVAPGDLPRARVETGDPKSNQ